MQSNLMALLKITPSNYQTLWFIAMNLTLLIGMIGNFLMIIPFLLFPISFSKLLGIPGDPIYQRQAGALLLFLTLAYIPMLNGDRFILKVSSLARLFMSVFWGALAFTVSLGFVLFAGFDFVFFGLQAWILVNNRQKVVFPSAINSGVS